MISNNGNSHFFIKKAYEICYALFRISTHTKRPSLADHLESQGLILLESAASGNYGSVGSSSVTIEYLLKIGIDLGMVNSFNYEIITSEIKHLNSAIAEFGNSAGAPVVDLSNIFSDMTTTLSGVEKNVSAKIEEHNIDHNNNESYDSGRQNGNSAIRQSAILDRIRQNGNCRLKEIQEILPGASERTLRYDFQRLLEQGLIERIGNSGPATYYRARV